MIFKKKKQSGWKSILFLLCFSRKASRALNGYTPNAKGNVCRPFHRLGGRLWIH